MIIRTFPINFSFKGISWTGCTWIDGDANGSNEQSIGSINSPAECVAICRTHLINGQKANVATVTSDGKSCFCETGATPISPSVGSYKHCFIRELSGKAFVKSFAVSHSPLPPTLGKPKSAGLVKLPTRC